MQRPTEGRTDWERLLRCRNHGNAQKQKEGRGGRQTDSNEELVQRSVNGSHGRTASFMLLACIYKELAAGIRARVPQVLLRSTKKICSPHISGRRGCQSCHCCGRGRLLAERTDADADVQPLRMGWHNSVCPCPHPSGRVRFTVLPVPFLPPARALGGAQQRAQGPRPPPFIT